MNPETLRAAASAITAKASPQAIAALKKKLEEIIEIRGHEEAEKLACEESLAEFIKRYWHIVEPSTPLVWGWTMQAVCTHLEAVTRGEIPRLIINVPPGFAKSIICNVFWPAWEWAQGLTGERYLCVSYSQSLTVRDNRRFLRLINSMEFQKRWPIKLDRESVISVMNSDTGWKLASSIGGAVTGERGSKIIIDDGNNVKDAESPAIIETTNLWLREVMPDRLNDMQTGAIVSIQQRTAETDVTATLLDMWGEDCVHLMIPMEYDPQRHCGTVIGWEDPRTYDGELAWPERFPEDIVMRLKRDKGPYAYAGQYQQIPAPRGGGIMKREWWQLWPPVGEEEAWTRLVEWVDAEGKRRKAQQASYPPFEYILASFDTAYEAKEENDFSAGVILGIFRRNGLSRIMLIEAWEERLEFHDLLKKIIATCKRRKVDAALVEGKASGKSILQEMRRICRLEEFTIHEIEPSGDKVARVHAIVPLMAAECVYAPDKVWAQNVIDRCAVFPKGKHKDLVDALSQGLSFLRKMGLALMPAENEAQIFDSQLYHGSEEGELPYDV